MPQSVARVAERFWAKVHMAAGDQCWVWAASRQRLGYGEFGYAGRVIGAHRMAWMLVNGAIPSGMCVLHRCDNPACVRPDHLFLGTQTDNIADRNAKGRSARLRGERNGNSRLSDRDADDICELHRRGVTGVDIARRFRVGCSTISRVINGQRRRA